MPIRRQNPQLVLYEDSEHWGYHHNGHHAAHKDKHKG